MDIDKTQKLSSEGLRKAKQLSLRQSVPPTEVPGHELQQFLGAGAYGEVWVGINTTTRRKVAVKFFLHHDAVDWSLLDRETEKMALLSSDRCVVQLLHVGWESDPRYYVMEYVENGSLEGYLREQGALPVSEAVAIFREIVVGMTHAHAKGVLHCDLKPANILLDEDNKPRLADFGQSRLTGEQSPALGTLFYMAPEQADLNARPDVRWDIYALGALLHTLLVGYPPHRTNEAIGKIDTATSLAQRLSRYRELIQQAELPTEHRQVHGVDNALADIIDRCLAAEPRERYATVREILDDLDARSRARSRRPLMMLGGIGPIVLLLIMLFFGYRGHQTAVASSTTSARQHAFEANTNATRYIAIALRAEIETIFRIAKAEATREQLSEMTQALNALPLVEELSQPTVSQAPDYEELVTQYSKLSESQHLLSYLSDRLNIHLRDSAADPNAPHLASMFVMNKAGVILAVAYADKSVSTRSMGRQYRYRSYYNGEQEDRDPTTDLTAVQPLQAPYFSAPFQSTSTKKWKVAVTVPFADGLLVVTVNLGEFTSLRANMNGRAETNNDRIATIIYGRQGKGRGAILQHPHFGMLEKLATNYRVSEDVLEQLEDQIEGKAEESLLEHDYQDPLRSAEGGERFAGNWIVTAAAVAWADESAQKNTTDLIVMLQEREDAVVAPVEVLSRALFREAGFAATGFVLTVFLLWYFVWRANREPSTRGREFVEGFETPLHEQATAAVTGVEARTRDHQA